MIQKRTTIVISAQPLQLEVVVERTHQEDALAAGELEVGALQDDRAGDDDEEAADEDEQQLGAAEDREGGEGAAEAERAGVAHEDLGRRGVPPEEADEGADDRGRDDREVERVAHVVALSTHVGVERCG